MPAAATQMTVISPHRWVRRSVLMASNTTTPAITKGTTAITNEARNRRAKSIRYDAGLGSRFDSSRALAGKQQAQHIAEIVASVSNEKAPAVETPAIKKTPAATTKQIEHDSNGKGATESSSGNGYACVPASKVLFVSTNQWANN